MLMVVENRCRRFCHRHDETEDMLRLGVMIEDTAKMFNACQLKIIEVLRYSDRQSQSQPPIDYVRRDSHQSIAFRVSRWSRAKAFRFTIF